MFDLQKLGEKAEGFVGLVLGGLGIISDVSKNAAVDKAVDVLMVVKGVLASLQHVYDGVVTPETVREEFAKLGQSLAANDKAANEALLAKWKGI